MPKRPYEDINLTDEQVEIFKKYYEKGVEISERRMRFLATEGVNFARLFVERFMEMRKGEIEDEIREQLLKKHFTDEEITDWFRYKDYMINERKTNPNFEFDLKYLKIASAYNEVVKRSRTKRK
jgi:hypothetical protein